MINTNNYSQNRGSEVINKMTDYTYSDTFYKEIVYDDYHSKWHSFHRLIGIVVEKVLISVDKWLIKCI